MSETTFERYRDKLEKTTISEKIDYKSLLIHGLRTVEASILSGNKYIIESSIWTFYNLIPHNWQDDDFRKEIESCYESENLDKRPIVAGTIRMSEETCEALGIIAFKQRRKIKHFKMLHSCVNLLERLGVLMRRTPKAWIRGKSGVEVPTVH